MQKAVKVGEGAMAALIGVEPDKAAVIAEEASAEGVCQVANDNGGGQVVLSGAKAAVDRAIEIAKAAGVKRSILLPVSAPFHCALMQPAADAMAAALADVAIAAPIVPLVANVTAAPVRDPDAIRRLLVDQVTATVRWARKHRLHGWARGFALRRVRRRQGVVGARQGGSRPSATGMSVNGPADVDGYRAHVAA